MDETLTYKCPNCGAGLLFDADEQRFSCEFCMSSFTEAELIELGSIDNDREAERANEEFRAEVDEYFCPSCGAEVLVDKSTTADFCYYCHNPIVLSGKMTGAKRPTKVIPFKFSKDEAKEKFLAFVKSKWFVPRDYFSKEHIEKMSGVYYPFWVTDADTDSAMNAIGKNIRTWRSGDYRYTETTTYSVYRRGRVHFEDITTAALSTEDKAMLEGVLPFPLDEYRDFSMPYLQGFVAKVRDVERESVGDEVKGRMRGYSEELLRRTTRYDRLDVTNLDLAILSSHWEYALLPLWVLTYKKKNKTYIYAMNGSTGKFYGELPVSIPKLLLLALGVFAAAVGLVWLIAYLFFM